MPRVVQKLLFSQLLPVPVLDARASENALLHPELPVNVLSSDTEKTLKPSAPFRLATLPVKVFEDASFTCMPSPRFLDDVLSCNVFSDDRNTAMPNLFSVAVLLVTELRCDVLRLIPIEPLPRAVFLAMALEDDSKRWIPMSFP